ncbi:MAG: hypothetical protein WBZ36_28360 [Candidatus Nitrosopolaris sp.]
MVTVEMQTKDREINELRKEMKNISQVTESLQKDLQDVKEFEVRRRNGDGHKAVEQEIIKEMERTGKDFKTVLSELLDTDAMILRVKNSKLPRIHREVILEDTMLIVYVIA